MVGKRYDHKYMNDDLISPLKFKRISFTQISNANQWKKNGHRKNFEKNWSNYKDNMIGWHALQENY